MIAAEAPDVERARLRRAMAILGVLVACWVAPAAAVPAARGGHTTADEPQYLMTALSLFEDRDLDVADERAEQRYRAFHRGGLPRQEEQRDDGSAVSPHDPLLPALLAVPMGLGGWVAAKLTLAALAGALAAAMLWVAVRRFGVPLRHAVVVVGAFSFGAPLAAYGTQVYPELPAALAVTVAIGALTGPLDRRGRVVLGVAVVALPWLAVKYSPVAATLSTLALWRLARRGDCRPAAVLGGSLLAAGACFAVAHLAWYGGLTPYASGAHFAGGELTVAGNDPDYWGRATRLAGLLVDRDFGLAAWHPAFLLAVPALAVLVRRRPPGWTVLALPLAAGWLNATFVALTMHGWWFPGRQVVVVLPCVVLAVAWAVGRPAPWARHALAACGVLGVLGASVFAWFVVEGIVSDLTLVVTFESMTHPVARAWRLLLPDYRRGGGLDWALHAVWLGALAASATGAWRLAGAARRAPAGVVGQPVGGARPPATISHPSIAGAPLTGG